MRRLPNDIDIHRHGPTPRRGAVTCFDPVDCGARTQGKASSGSLLPAGDGPISVGIHPWNADKADEAVWQRLADMLDDPRVVAIGEIGLDRAHGPEMDVQLDVFRRQLAMAEELDIPVVIHSVRATDLLLALRKELKPTVQWIFHGYRGNAAQARQLLNAGIDLSFGLKYNPEAYDAVPPDRRYHETDMDAD